MSDWPVRGAIFALGDAGATTMVTMGFRNPIALRCETKHNVCLATELALDYSETRGGREKLVPIRPSEVLADAKAALTGKLGSLGQPVLRAKAKEMERQFAARLAEAFAAPAPNA